MVDFTDAAELLVDIRGGIFGMGVFSQPEMPSESSSWNMACRRLTVYDENLDVSGTEATSLEPWVNWRFLITHLNPIFKDHFAHLEYLGNHWNMIWHVCYFCQVAFPLEYQI